MPFYDYKCPDCGSVKEFYERIDGDKAVHECSCTGEMKRIITSPASIKLTSRPVGWNLSASERRARWNSSDPREKI